MAIPPSAAPSERWAALVLAAGVGARLGGVLKPLLQIDGQALIERLLQSLRAAGLGEITVVVARGNPLRGALQHLDESTAATVRWTEVPSGHDQMHSLQQGLRALAHGNGDVLVCLADQPLMGAPAIAALMQAHAARPEGTDMVVPWVQQRPGHPVTLSPRLVQQWVQADVRQIGKAWRETHPARVHAWPSTDPGFIVDIDTPQDLLHLQAQGWAIGLPAPSGKKPP